MFSSSFCVSTMNINNISLSRMSTIFCLLISISSLHKVFISLGSLLKGSSSLPWLISSQPHRSQAFPTQRSLCSHKDPRNPAACPQLIFPVAILLTQPPTGRGCKCKPGTGLSVCNPPPQLPSFGPQRSGRSVNHCGGLNRCPLSASRAFQPHPRPSADQTTWPPPTTSPTVEFPLDFLLHLPLPVCLSACLFLSL